MSKSGNFLKNFQQKSIKGQILSLLKLSFIVLLLFYVGSVAVQFTSNNGITPPDPIPVIKWGLTVMLMIFLGFVIFKITPKVVNKFDSGHKEEYDGAFIIVRTMIATSTLVSATTTAIGLWFMSVKNDGSTQAIGTFFILIIGLTVSVFGLWFMFTKMAGFDYSRAKASAKIVLASTLLFFMSTNFFASTTTSVMGLGGRQAFVSHMIHELDFLAVDIIEVSNFRAAEKNFYDALIIQKGFWINIAKEEAETGTYTGSTGKGALSRYLRGIGETFGAIGKGLEKGELLESEKNIIILIRDIESMKDELSTKDYSVVFDNRSLYEEKIRALYERANNLSSESQLKGAKTILDNFEAFNPETNTDNGLIAQKQKEMMITFSGTMTKSMKSLHKLMNEAVEARPDNFRYETIDLLDAAFVYARKIKEFWAISVLLDIIPFFIFLWLLCFKDELYRRPEGKAKEFAESTSS